MSDKLKQKLKQLVNGNKPILYYDPIKLIKQCSVCNCGDFTVINYLIICLDCGQRFECND